MSAEASYRLQKVGGMVLGAPEEKAAGNVADTTMLLWQSSKDVEAEVTNLSPNQTSVLIAKGPPPSSMVKGK